MNKLNLEATEIFCAILEKSKHAPEGKLKSSGFMDLTVEKIGERVKTKWGYGSLYSLVHYYEKEGDLMKDPEMVFIVVDNREQKTDYLMVGIYPQMYQQDDMGIYHECASIEDGKVISFIPSLQFNLCQFAQTWMINIKEQNFL